MLDRGIGDKQWKLTALHQAGHQESVFGAESNGIENALSDVDRRPANRKSRSIQVSDATVRLQHVLLKHRQSQFLGFANRSQAIAHEMQLKVIVLWRIRDL